MDERKDSQGSQSSEGSYEGYSTPGSDKIIESTSEAIQSPSQPSETRMDAPKPVIESLGETPGDANPALAETVGAQQGQTSTADMLMAREGAEESRLRATGAGATDAMYQDQQGGVASQEYLDSDSGRPNWPDDRQREPMDYADAPRANVPLGAGNASALDPNLRGRMDATIDRGSTEASYAESRSGLPAVGWDEAGDTYERREMDNPTPPSDMDLIAPEMSNLPTDDDDD
ncbi:MAG TPA: hypothetical protein VJ183_06575 [Chloroflexia bacterium]|nr:hypothetical protein [Chloroflexia bacterium]